MIAGPVRANTKLEIGFRENSFCLESILTDDVWNLHFRTAQGQVNRRSDSEEKNHRDRNHDCDTSEDGNNSGNYTHQVAKSNLILIILQILSILFLFEDGDKEPIGSLALRPRANIIKQPEALTEHRYHVLILIALH